MLLYVSNSYQTLSHDIDWGMTNLNRLIYLKYQQRHWTQTNLQGKHPIQEDSQPQSSASSPAAWEKANQKRTGEFTEHSDPWGSQSFKVCMLNMSLKCWLTTEHHFQHLFALNLYNDTFYKFTTSLERVDLHVNCNSAKLIQPLSSPE